jgi:hypothetical protein
MGCGLRGALVLGARLLLRARDTAADMAFFALRALYRCVFEKGSRLRDLDAARFQGESEWATSI